MKLSIVIPMLNEGEAIASTLTPLQKDRSQGVELIVVDGGSSDNSCELALPLTDQLLHAPPGRARQMNLGAAHARGELLLFLHADSRLPENYLQLLVAATAGRQQCWGRFNVRLSGEKWLFRVIETMMNWRSRLSGICTGDQAIFLSAPLWQRCGGFPQQPLMEDIELSRRLKRYGSPLAIRPPLVTSSRRWEENGTLRTIVLMWRLRLLYFFGVSAETLSRQYR
ncbi:MAG: TIGR04283 family arsenosugar biosynthesis glycosyltransferase [Gammaproteobacteria bacterium]|nr:TIGR04283 family arsenosugar biosynthesis glycosyltransferase [Gammaproteobacteria bacterium]